MDPFPVCQMTESTPPPPPHENGRGIISSAMDIQRCGDIISTVQALHSSLCCEGLQCNIGLKKIDDTFPYNTHAFTLQPSTSSMLLKMSVPILMIYLLFAKLCPNVRMILFHCPGYRYPSKTPNISSVLMISSHMIGNVDYWYPQVISVQCTKDVL